MTKHPAVSGDLEGISSLIVGGAVFNTQYNDNPEDLAIEAIISYALDNGMNAFDTSPYYGPSEVMIGQAFKSLTDKGIIARENYYICTKVGRIRLDEFDYSAEWVKKSIARSLERLHTTYLDVVHLHDIEFCTETQIFEALSALKELKAQGVIKYVGISGYPVDFLYQIAKKAKETASIGSLDTVMSYSNMCLQNTTLLEYHDRFFQDCDIKMLNNASILSMSLLRTGSTKTFHPAPQELKDTCEELGKQLKEKYDEDLTDLSVRFALRGWNDKRGSTVIGCSNVAELEDTAIQFKTISENGSVSASKDAPVVEFAQKFLGTHLNEVWKSGIEH
ncbi:unnamed protein product [Kuraishia capsulata CBS 1993]|uniref:NADP-dependent oxidoreductase domain-containing protein n=1 Tax=Kuraishia capsulata CBS 1993 TaxID=1382522 RepID=W6MLL8_9ASCO|nr:uncharacterized protein KUCA_T00001712001 [Kuraishia capsulata CBS 1993]CDK25742.1 unnamed protein product [Kuraishia capsulata CBS 1993]